MNIYQSFLLTAIKFSANVRAVLRGRRSSHFAKFFIGMYLLGTCNYVVIAWNDHIYVQH